MSRPITRRQVLRAAVPVCAGLAGSFVGATAMFRAEADGDSDADAERAQRTSATSTPDTIEAAAIPTTPAVLLAFTRPTLDPGIEPAARAHSGVDALSLVRGGIANFVAARDSEDRVIQQTQPPWTIPLEGIAVDPAAHAQFASKADSAMLLALGDGQALLGRTSAELRKVSAGGTLEFEGGLRVLVAGVVEDATIGCAELAVTRPTGDAIGLNVDRYLLMSHTGDRGGLESVLKAAIVTPDTDIRFRAPGETPFLRQGEAVLPPVQIKERFGEFELNRNRPESPEEPDDFWQEAAWQNENLITIDLPIITEATGRRATCHRGIATALVGALNEVITLNLAGLIDPEGYEGCYNPRFVRKNPWDVSRHAWGIAIDLNYEANRTGTESIQDPRIIDVFRRWGFTEGSNWLVPDAGHFEFVGP